MNMLLNGCQTENCNSWSWTEFVLFRYMLWLLTALLIKSCAVTNPYYEAEVIFFVRTCFLGGEKKMSWLKFSQRHLYKFQSSDIFWCEEWGEVYWVLEGVFWLYVVFCFYFFSLSWSYRKGLNLLLFFLLILCPNILQFQSMLAVYHATCYRNWKYTGNAEIALPAESLNIHCMLYTSILCLLYWNLK